MTWLNLRVPASSANLGPGFDTLGLALGIYLECRFRKSSQLVIRAAGRDACAIPLDETNLIWRTAQDVAADVGGSLPPSNSKFRTISRSARDSVRAPRR